MIEIEGVTKRFGSKTAVRDLQLTVSAGELFAFLGPNGAGKTTTIKMIVGLLRPDEGRIRVCGHDSVDQHLESAASISYIPDQPYLYDKLTGREFLEFVARMYEMPQAEARQRIGELSELFELHDYIDDLCEGYSHGMKQRVVVTAALLHDPKVIVVDEPMVGLDPKSARLVKDTLRSKSRGGVTVFMSTHTMAVAEELADRVGIIHEGNLIALGTLAEIESMAPHARCEGLEEAFLQITAESANGRSG